LAADEGKPLPERDLASQEALWQQAKRSEDAD